MSKTLYPYQIQQDFIDQYLEIPRELRPPLLEWAEEAALEKVAYVESILPTMSPEKQAHWEWLKPYINELRFNYARCQNRAAAERRRAWHRKASTLLS